MQAQRTICVFVLFAMAIIPLPAVATGGAFYIEGRCWCDPSTFADGENVFAVWYIPDSENDCAEPLQAAFRIAGVPDDAAMGRTFDSVGIPMSGDVFGEGARFTALEPYPGELILGIIRINLTAPLPQQVWSIEAHQGIEGVTSPVMEFNSNRGTWIPQPGRSLTIDGEGLPCQPCAFPFVGCPFAVESKPWSLVKQLYQ